MRKLPIRGSILNAGSVAIGASIGLLLGARLSEAMLQTVLAGLGLVTLGLGLKMFLESKNLLIVASAVAVGGVLGYILGVKDGLDLMAEAVRTQVGGTGRFNEGLISASVLFCVGPMTLLGCLQDGLEGKIELLAIKSLMDGIVSVFFAATMGVGVLLSAVVVLVIQGLLTLLSKPLVPLAERPNFLAEISGTGGILLMSIGIGLCGIKKLPTENLLPALLIAPCLVWLVSKFEERKVHA